MLMWFPPCRYCPSCKEFQQATKQLGLYTLPEVLIVHLKRFRYSGQFRERIDTNVEFPVSGLDLREFLVDPSDHAASTVYDLFAVSNHHGTSAFGHYTAYALNSETGKWYNFDDSSTSEVHGDCGHRACKQTPHSTQLLPMLLLLLLLCRCSPLHWYLPPHTCSSIASAERRHTRRPLLPPLRM